MRADFLPFPPRTESPEAKEEERSLVRGIFPSSHTATTKDVWRRVSLLFLNFLI